jgi:hypothetical protein
MTLRPSEQESLRMRMLAVLWICCLAALAGPAMADAQQVRAAGGASVTLRGIINATSFGQDAHFGPGNGHASLWVTAADPDETPRILGADVRATRIGIDIAGAPVVGGWSAGGTVELDFFGGFALQGHLADEQPNPRLRLAFADMRRGGTTLRMGQATSPSFGYMPASLSHFADPLGFGSAGLIGWRIPGIFLYQSLPAPGARTALQLQLAAMRGSWEQPGGATPGAQRSRETAFPQLEGRLDASGRTAGGMQWGAFVAGHYDQKDVPGPGLEDETLSGTAVIGGLRATPGRFTVHGTGYSGRAIGQIRGNLLQVGDIGGYGAWAQAGYALSTRWSTWLFFGFDDPDDDDVRREVAGNARLRNEKLATMLRFSEGPFAVGLEWLNATTDWRLTGPGGPVDVQRTGKQVALSVYLAF